MFVMRFTRYDIVGACKTGASGNFRYLRILKADILKTIT